MKDFYTAKDIAEKFGKTVDWVYSVLFNMGIKADAIGEDYENMGLNLYSKKQVEHIEKVYYHNLKSNIIYVKTTYLVYESKLNYTSLEDL